MANDRKAATRASIVSAALELFGRHGFDGATVKAVADRAGFSTAAVHWHFGTKAALYAEAAREAGERFLAAMPGGAAEPFPDLARRWIEGMRSATASARLLRGLAGHLGNPVAADAAARINDRFVDYWCGWFRERARDGPGATERLPGALVVALLTGLVATAGDGGGVSALLEDLPRLLAFVGEDGSIRILARVETSSPPQPPTW